MDTVDPQQKTDFQLIENIPFTTAKVIGSRASIGMVVLASDYTIEHEFRTLIDMPGVDVFEARIRNDPQVTPETLAAMEPLLTSTAELILPGDATRRPISLQLSPWRLRAFPRAVDYCTAPFTTTAPQRCTRDVLRVRCAETAPN